MGEPIKDGGPAFAALATTGLGDIHHQPGMSLRDYFAAQVLASASALPIGASDCAHRAKLAYEQADAMLAAREAKP